MSKLRLEGAAQKEQRKEGVKEDTYATRKGVEEETYNRRERAYRRPYVQTEEWGSGKGR